MDALEEYKIYKMAILQKEQLLNDTVAFKSNVMFDTMICKLIQTKLLPPSE